MEVNGQNSCTRNSRHINIRYFFVHDSFRKGDLKIMHCPADIMVSDFFTKPFDGFEQHIKNMFNKFSLYWFTHTHTHIYI